jgi:hypothetical protein
LWLLIEDVDSYDPARVVAGWAKAELIGPNGTVPLGTLASEVQPKQGELELKEGSVPALLAGTPSTLRWNLAGRGFTRFRAEAAVDERSRKSDIGPAVRFFVFTEKPDHDQLIRVQGGTPAPLPPSKKWTADALTDRLYLHLMSRRATPAERRIAAEVMGSKPTAAGLEDVLWALLMSPEFQYIH